MDDVEAIKQLKARYFRLMDTKDWDGMREVFADDVYIDTTDSGGRVVEGADDFMAGLREILADVVTVHHGHMPEIELTSATTATGVSGVDVDVVGEHLAHAVPVLGVHQPEVARLQLLDGLDVVHGSTVTKSVCSIGGLCPH